jgi:hypothetical protein
VFGAVLVNFLRQRISNVTECSLQQNHGSVAFKGQPLLQLKATTTQLAFYFFGVLIKTPISTTAPTDAKSQVQCTIIDQSAIAIGPYPG